MVDNTSFKNKLKSKIDSLSGSGTVQEYTELLKAAQLTNSVYHSDDVNSLPDASKYEGQLAIVGTSVTQYIYYCDGTTWDYLHQLYTNEGWGWGVNTDAQLGDNTVINKSSPIQLNSVHAYTWEETSVGRTHGASLDDTSVIWVWGYGGDGQLGLNNAALNYSSPVQMSSDTWDTISCGYRSIKAIKPDGTLWTWGSNSSGHVGDNTALNRSSPVQVSGGGTWSQIDDGIGNFSVSIGLKTDGTIWTWGYNNFGGVGDNTTVSKSSPVQVSGGGTNWSQVSSGYYHTAAIKTDGTLWGWGHGANGQLAQTDVINHSSPVQENTGSTWLLVSAGSGFTLGIKTDGTLWSCGYNGPQGRLGDGTNIQRSSPVQISGSGVWSSISAANNHSAALKTDGTLWCWGSGDSGKLGLNSITSYSSPIQELTQATDWVTIDTGMYDTIAIKSSIVP